MNPTIIALQLAEKRQMLGALQHAYSSTEYKLAEIAKERLKLDANERNIRNLHAQAPARIAQIQKEIESLTAFSAESGNQNRRLDRQAKSEIIITEIFQALEKLDKDSALYKALMAEVQKAVSDANSPD